MTWDDSAEVSKVLTGRRLGWGPRVAIYFRLGSSSWMSAYLEPIRDLDADPPGRKRRRPRLGKLGPREMRRRSPAQPGLERLGLSE